MRTFYLSPFAIFLASPALAGDAVPCANPETSRGRAAIEDGREKPCAVAPDPTQTVEPRLRASTPAERQAVIRYFNTVLKDGPSARWQWDGTWRDGWVCGKVNAKNSFGGYGGWEAFAYRSGYGFLSEDGRNHWSDENPAPCLLSSYIKWNPETRRYE